MLDLENVALLVGARTILSVSLLMAEAIYHCKMKTTRLMEGGVRMREALKWLEDLWKL